MVVHAERRRVVEPVEVGVGGAGGEDPVVAPAEPAAGRGQRERDGDAVLDRDLRRVRGRDGDEAVRVPAAHAQMPRRRLVRVGGLEIGGQRARERDRPLGVVDRHLAHLPGLAVELAAVVEDLDPVVVRDAQHVVPANRGEPQHRRGHHLHHRHRDGGVLPRPLESGRAARLAALVDLDAVGLVLEPAVAALRRQLAWIVRGRDVDLVGGQPPVGRPDDVQPAGNVVVVCVAGGAWRDGVQPHLPGGLPARRRVDADGDLDEIRGLQVRELALPYVEVSEERAGGRDRVRSRPVRLREVGGVDRPRPLGEQRVEAVHLDAMVLGEEPVDVHAAAADGERAAGGGDLERVRRLARHPRHARRGRSRGRTR